jgi:ATP-binding cassette, subfamily F, member 3
MISVEQVKLNFGGFELFKGFSFIINPRDRIGLVGRNGAGKSTLMKVIAGQQATTEGGVVVPKNVTVGYLPQTMVVTNNLNVIEETQKAFGHIIEIEKDLERLNIELAHRDDYESEDYHKIIQKVTDLTERYNLLGGHSYLADLEVTLTGLGFSRKDFTRMTSEFSGGWRMRIELAKLLLQKPDVFLLDEPTNHLDIESIQWLEDFLKTYSGAVVLVSHDKAFLDAVTNRTVEISLGSIYDYKANYSKYVELRAERREQQLSAFRNQQKMINDTEDFIERFRYKATKAVQVQSRIKQLDKIDRIEIDEEDNSALNIKFPPAPHAGRIIVEVKELSKSYGSLQVLSNIDLLIENGQKIAFVGKNGEGKTTLARVILNELECTGLCKLGHGVKVGYFAQNQANLLDGEKTVLETIDSVAVGDVRTKIRDILGAFMFSGEDVEKKVKVLSGGERTRLAMIRLMLEPVNLLVLDEPTNHLDMRSKEILKEALRNFDGTVLVVSHDREFLDGLIDIVYEFRNKKIVQHLGGIYEFIRKRKLENLKELERKPINVSSSFTEIKISNGNNELSFEEKKDINRTITRIEKKIEENEKIISNLEAEIEAFDYKLSNPDAQLDHSVFEKYEKLKKQLEETLNEWGNLHEELEEKQALKTW